MPRSDPQHSDSISVTKESRNTLSPARSAEHGPGFEEGSLIITRAAQTDAADAAAFVFITFEIFYDAPAPRDAARNF